MSWTHSYHSSDPARQQRDMRLSEARSAFLAAKRALEQAHVELLRAHSQAVRGANEDA
ncbi:hypothetical protein ACH3VR_08685 [Microbacterium sp. B2969]|uniref:Uncharacterized protein n=1 Tax=Microbacterium alkaliflavum TaxID=3248839 RepID=A0ABW7QA61_9MICO